MATLVNKRRLEKTTLREIIKIKSLLTYLKGDIYIYHGSDSFLALIYRLMVVMVTVVSHSDFPFKTEAFISPGAGSVIETFKSLSKSYPLPKKLPHPRS